MAGLRDALSALLGVSTYERPKTTRDDRAEIDRIRAEHGGNLGRAAQTQTRWYTADVEDAIVAADRGDLRLAAKLWRAMRRDGVISGLLSTCTDGLVRLPKQFVGDQEQVDLLKSGNGTISLFDSMFPAVELARMAADGIGLGYGIGEMRPVSGRDYPVFVRLEPELARYREDENRWYFQSYGKELPITPGDGQWILHTPGGRVSPWQAGKAFALGDPWVDKQHARAYRRNWESKLANAARVAVAPNGASEEQAESWFRAVMAWGVNTVFGMKPGYDVKLIESNGRGFESFGQTIKDANEEFMIALAGQLVTTTGGTGFANADIHKSIRADIIVAIADSLAHTINTQGLPPWVVNRWGREKLDTRAMVGWDVAPAKDRMAEATAITSLANGLKVMRESLAPYQLDLDIGAVLSAHGIATVGVEPTAVAVTQRIELAPTDIAKVVRVDEARSSQGLPPIGDARGLMTITELEQVATTQEAA